MPTAVKSQDASGQLHDLPDLGDLNVEPSNLEKRTSGSFFDLHAKRLLGREAMQDAHHSKGLLVRLPGLGFNHFINNCDKFTTNLGPVLLLTITLSHQNINYGAHDHGPTRKRSSSLRKLAGLSLNLSF